MKINSDLATFNTFLGASPAAAWYLMKRKAPWRQQGAPEVNQMHLCSHWFLAVYRNLCTALCLQQVVVAGEQGGLMSKMAFPLGPSSLLLTFAVSTFGEITPS